MSTDQPTQPTYPRLSMDAHEHVHMIAAHLEIHGPYHMALDPGQAQHMAVVLRETAAKADINAEAYNDAVEALERAERSLALSDALWDRLIGLAKTLGLVFAIGALVAALTWIG